MNFRIDFILIGMLMVVLLSIQMCDSIEPKRSEYVTHEQLSKYVDSAMTESHRSWIESQLYLDENIDEDWLDDSLMYEDGEEYIPIPLDGVDSALIQAEINYMDSVNLAKRPIDI